MRILILGINGFIGHSLTSRILENTDWEICGMDLDDHRISDYYGHPRLTFLQGDISLNRDWIDRQIERSDIVLPLAAIANPSSYVKMPLKVFSLVFEENLWIVKQCVRHQTRLVFPSTSEVYGMCTDEKFNEELSLLVLGPINKERWIYSCAKQLLDRVIWAYGAEGLRFTILRPFNWIGPNLDNIDAAERGSSRVLIQFLGNLLRNEPILLVDGGHQRRTFTYIDDGIDALMHILRNKNGAADGKIYNIGNPANECSIRDLAYHLVDTLAGFPGYEYIHNASVIRSVAASEYYGNGYQDVARRKPDIMNLQTSLGWQPQVGLAEALRRIIAFYISQPADKQLREIAARSVPL